jgi:hypothetical protein
LKVPLVTSPNQTRSQSASKTSRSGCGAGDREQLGEERGAAAFEVTRIARRQRAELGGDVGGPDRRPAAAVERHAAVAFAERAAADPHQLPSAPRAEHARVEAAHARRQDPAFEIRERQRHAFELRKRFVEPAFAAVARADAVPRRQEAREHARLDRRDLAAQLRHRAAADPAQHFGVAPLALATARAELARKQPPARFESPAPASACAGQQTKLARARGGERRVRARIAQRSCSSGSATGSSSAAASPAGGRSRARRGRAQRPPRRSSAIARDARDDAPPRREFGDPPDRARFAAPRRSRRP